MGEQASGGTGQGASVSFDGGHAMPARAAGRPPSRTRARSRGRAGVPMATRSAQARCRASGAEARKFSISWSNVPCLVRLAPANGRNVTSPALSVGSSAAC